MNPSRAAFLGGLGAAALLPCTQSYAETPTAQTKATIVLVHGALTDALSWRHVITLLQRAGHPVIALENPLDSLASDVANTREVLRGVVGPVIVVGHSYGGCVVTGAATGLANVQGLVYVAALVPDKGQSANQLVSQFPALPSSRHFRPRTAGRVILDPQHFSHDFAADVGPEEARVLAVCQKSIAVKAFSEKSADPAWRSIRSWYAVSTNDRALHPDLQILLAQKIGARTIRLQASHASYISRPRDVAALILRSAHAQRERFVRRRI